MNKRITSTLSVIICVLMIFGIFPIYSNAATPSALIITLNETGENLNIHTPHQTEFIDGPYENIPLYANGTQELSHPNPIIFSWQVTRIGNIAQPSKYTLKITDNPEMTGGNSYSTTTPSATIYNLRPCTRYYWQVSATVGSVTYTSDISTFSTDNRLPYNLKVGGVTNVRDLGGYTTSDGGRVKFGMLFRTGRLNENYSTTATISSSGINTLKNEFHIRSEIDLRGTTTAEYGGRTTSTLGSDVNYLTCPMNWDGNILESSNYGSIKKVFGYLANERYYPMIFHCSIGTDRTGLIAYLVNALLGVSENDLMRDYLFSNFGNINSPRLPRTINKLYPMLIKRYYGATLSEKTYNFLNREVGISTSTLNSIIRILKEYPADPVRTEISSTEQFSAMSPDGDYILTADLTLDSTYSSKFTGSIDGGGHTITTSTPIFANFCGDIKNLTIDGNIISDSGNTAALTVATSGMKAENVTNNANISLFAYDGDFCAGGFAAKATSGDVYLRSCTNNGTLIASGETGGFIALCSGGLTMTDCVNNGNIICIKEVSCGGIAAETVGGLNMEKCFNFGDITGNGEYTAGIIARVSENAGYENMKTVSSVGNYGDVTGGTYTSGLFGQVIANTGSITYSYNMGDVKGLASSGFVTGLVANFNNSIFNISRCYNAGEITAMTGAQALQLFHTENTAIDTNYLYRDYALTEISTPAFCYKNSSGQIVTRNAVSGNATAIPFSLADLFGGNLRTAVNGSVAVYSQIANHASMTDIIDDDLIMTGTQRILGKFFSFDGNGTYIGALANNYTGLYTENGGLRYAENGQPAYGWKTVGDNTYYFDPYMGTAVTGLQIIDGKTYNFDENGILLPTPPVTEATVSVENYIITFENAEDVEFIRIAPGDLGTTSSIKNAPGCISINESVIDSQTDGNGDFHYELPDGGIWSVWFRYSDGSEKIISALDNRTMTQSVDTYGVTVTVKNLYGVKDYYIAQGHYTTYREIKNVPNHVGITSTKIAGAHSYKHGAAIGDPGEYTICIRYNDGRPDRFLYFKCEVTYPTLDTFGKDITFGNIDDIRVIRVAPGTYSTVNAVKNAEGVRNFTAKTIDTLANPDGSLTVNNAVEDNGLDTAYTVTVEYRNLYAEVHNITLNKIMPTYTVSNGIITFTDLDGLSLLRYAPGSFSTASGIKNAPGNRYIKGANVTGETITLDLSGLYSFLVQYREGSMTVFQTEIND